MSSSVAVPSAPPIAAPGSTNKTGTVGVWVTDVKVSLGGEVTEKKQFPSLSKAFPARTDLLLQIGVVIAIETVNWRDRVTNTTTKEGWHTDTYRE